MAPLATSQAAYGLPSGRPAGLSAYNDDFGGPLAKAWVPYGTADTISTSTVPGSVYISKASAGTSIAGIAKACPLMPFIYETRISAYSVASNYVSVGLMFAMIGGGTLLYGGLWNGYGSSQVDDVLTSIWGSTVSRISSSDTNHVITAPVRMRAIVRSATSWDFAYSVNDGVTWTTTHSAISAGPPAAVGLHIAGQSGGGAVMGTFDWVRFS